MKWREEFPWDCGRCDFGIRYDEAYVMENGKHCHSELEMCKKETRDFKIVMAIMGSLFVSIILVPINFGLYQVLLVHDWLKVAIGIIANIWFPISFYLFVIHGHKWGYNPKRYNGKVIL